MINGKLICSNQKWRNLLSTLTISLLVLSSTSCSKYLDKKSNARLAIPTTLKDIQLLLDDYSIYNSYSALPEVLSDNYYLTTSSFNSISDPVLRDLHTWQPNLNTEGYWRDPYKWMLNANVIIDAAKNITIAEKERDEFNRVVGSAYFLRGLFLYNLSQIYCDNYQSDANKKLGLVLKLTSNVEEDLKRSTLEETYKQILIDLHKASVLLPEETFLKTRPTLAAAQGAMARIFLSMQKYDSAKYYAQSVLDKYDSLMDFNEINYGSNAPIPQFNKEVLFTIRGNQLQILSPANAKIDSNLFDSYELGDLRKSAFFRSNGDGTYRFKGDYDGSGSRSGYAFGGIVTDELYLILAECLARDNKVVEAMSVLNRLLRKRWDKNLSYVEKTANSMPEALSIILAERRKELIFRGVRWTDLRRLRFDPDFSVTPKRVLDEKEFLLEPNNPRYTLLIPILEINRSGIAQNP